MIDLEPEDTTGVDTKTEDVVPDLPDIHNYPKIIREAENHKLAFFVGAGISKLVQPACPSWQEMGHKILKGLLDNGVVRHREYTLLRDIGGADPKRLLSMIWRKAYRTNRNKYDLRKELGKIFPRPTEANIYDCMCGLDAVFVTTNYDLCFEYATNRKLMSEDRPRSEGDEVAARSIDEKVRELVHIDRSLLSARDLRNGHVYHIHGSVTDYKTMVVTAEHYLDAYERGGWIEKFLETLFTDRTVVFIGSSLSEMEILRFVRSRTSKKGRPVLLDHYALVGASRHDTDLMEYQGEYCQQLGIELIPFCTDDNGYFQLVDILREWSNTLTRVESSVSFFKGRRFLDDVLAKRT